MDELLTIREVAGKLKISVSSVYRYVESGRFPHIKIGTNIRFTQEHIAAFLDKNPVKANPDKPYEPSPAELQAMYDLL
jgi:excisionase family DNA binding protein